MLWQTEKQQKEYEDALAQTSASDTELESVGTSQASQGSQGAQEAQGSQGGGSSEPIEVIDDDEEEEEESPPTEPQGAGGGSFADFDGPPDISISGIV